MQSVYDPLSAYQRPVELLQRLIRFDTSNPPGNEAECISFINGLLTEAGIATAILARNPQRPNIVARLRGQGRAAPLLLYGHVDVVTTENQNWKHPPFSGDIFDGYVWGRGCLDMKSGVAMMLAAFLRVKIENLKPDGRLFSKLGIQTYGFLPMKLPKDFNFSQKIHAANERVPVEAIDFGTNAIWKLLQRFGQSEQIIMSALPGIINRPISNVK